ncbi:LPS biosynthesis glycosyltransferase [filamentous cyanobacterium LEGE 11480]|uniref:LPS biosynthesis glycosyltransferase n=1 Tax=Romeriopsis navalis LEGE 11480 TaxID=2777977 RepID=A0A928Z6D2_9CYAN|nr:LPS biosynthesis glycosyltransferase [Romeriopsis navalis]MBE9032120.1 LPS biosynthesis glycosyltransferase [Romeriopsis navalis LEGE 11480]
MQQTNSLASQPALAEQLQSVFIIAHRESTDQLESILQAEGLTTNVLRQVVTPELQSYSPSYRCLLNHYNAWQQIAQSPSPVMIIEADFVPICHFGQAPMPMPIDDPQAGITWLYTCASQLYTVTEQGFAEGFSVSTVAYILTPKAAKALLDFIQPYAETPERYSSWDSTLAEFLLKRGFTNYIPFRNYGEHGGIPNPEHRKHGLSSAHRADSLYDRLAFQPPYADNHLNVWKERSQARLKGFGRLLLGRYLRPKVCFTSSIPLRLLRFAILRQFSLHLPDATADRTAST